MFRRALLAAVLVSLLGAPAARALQESPPPAPEAAPVYCGSFTCFVFRVPAGGSGPDARASAAIATINKFLGGRIGKVTLAPSGKNIRLLLNNELVAVVTPADAEAEKHKSVATLAARWARRLGEAFESTKSQK